MLKYELFYALSLLPTVFHADSAALLILYLSFVFCGTLTVPKCYALFKTVAYFGFSIEFVSLCFRYSIIIQYHQDNYHTFSMIIIALVIVCVCE